MAADHITPITEAQMVERARGGDAEAFAEIYRREAPLAWRLAVAITRSPSAARSALTNGFAKLLAGTPGMAPFNGDLTRHLLAAIRAAAIGGNGSGVDHLDDPLGNDHDDERATVHLHTVPTTTGGGSLTLEAFHGLPERWRTILWLTDAEGVDTALAAAVLETDVHAAEELAVRARHGLRERFTRAHMAVAGTSDCERVARRLDDYASEELSIRGARHVRRHLDGCEACRERLAELDDLAPRLRFSAPPLPAVLAHESDAAWRAASVVAAGPLHLVLPSGRRVPAWAERAAAGVAAAVITLGITGAIIAGGRGKPRTDRLAREAANEEPLAGANGENALGSVGDLPLLLPEGTPVPTFGNGLAGSSTDHSDTAANGRPRSAATASPLPSTTPTTIQPTTTTTEPTPTTRPAPPPSSPSTTVPGPESGDGGPTTAPLPVPEPLAPIVDAVESTVDQVVGILDPLTGGSTSDAGTGGVLGGLLGG